LAKVAVNQSKIFTQGALKTIVNGAKGIPRNLNILCDNALITGFGYKIKPVNTKVVKEVIADFNGKEKPSLLKWIIPFMALLIFILGLITIYPHKDKGLILSKVQSPAPSQTRELKSIKEEMKPPIDKPDISQTEQSIPAKEEMKPAKEKAIPETSKTSSSMIRTVKKGDTLYKLTRIVYGYADDKLVALVRQNNPWIKDMNNLAVGEEIIFPVLVEDQVKGKAKGKE
jgi:general secretion pathway protein A